MAKQEDKDKYKQKAPEETQLDEKDKVIIEAAVAGLKEHGLDERWGPIISGTEPGKPHQVARLDAEVGVSASYYIVPFIADDKVPLAVKVGDSEVNFQQAVAAQTSKGDVISIISPQEAIEKAIGVTLQFDDGMRIKIREENIPEQTPELAWEPCVQSFSPFWPFYLLTIIDEKRTERIIYVRASDGETFTRLQTNVGGA